MTKIGRYEIKDRLGEGGMAVVYLAHDPNFDRDVVVKVIRRDYGADDEFRARFHREARVIARLEHEAIAPVYDFGEHDGQPFIIMRHLPGGSLADRMARGPLPLAQAARIVERIADALDYAHSRGVIHRDLKPANILFDDRGKAYLSDFGIAKLAEATAKLTGMGIIGTPAYMSPEQARANAELDRRSDVYSLGVMIFELLTGELPFKAREATGFLLAHVNEPVPDIRKARPDLPRESDAFIKRAMAKKPEDRYPTTGDLARDLSLIATKPSKGRAPAERPAGSAPTPPPPSAERTRPDTPPPGDLRPTGVIVEPVERPTGSVRPRRSAARWLLPSALAAVFCLAASIGGAIALSALLAQGAPQPTDAAAAATQPPDNPTTQPPNNPTTKATHTPTLSPGATRIAEKDGMVMVYVPAGPFEMGSNDGSSDEQPVHTVTLDAFWIDQTEVTNAMFLAFLEDMVARSQAQMDSSRVTGSNGNPLYYFYRITRSGVSLVVAEGYDEHPVARVAWYGANAYCEWADRRLPTEAEWEKAARGNDGRTYPWGNDSPDANLLNFNSSVGDTTEVGSYPNGASPYGALDMAGNVWEWVADWYDENYYDNSPSENPQGPSSGQYRVLRGGSWLNGARNVRASGRVGDLPGLSVDGRLGFIGFRCSR